MEITAEATAAQTAANIAPPSAAAAAAAPATADTTVPIVAVAFVVPILLPLIVLAAAVHRVVKVGVFVPVLIRRRPLRAVLPLFRAVGRWSAVRRVIWAAGFGALLHPVRSRKAAALAANFAKVAPPGGVTRQARPLSSLMQWNRQRLVLLMAVAMMDLVQRRRPPSIKVTCFIVTLAMVPLRSVLLLLLARLHRLLHRLLRRQMRRHMR